MNQPGKRTLVAALVAGCLALAANTGAYARGGPPGGMPGGARPGGGPNSGGNPNGMPQGNRPVDTQSNPNGNAPIGKATSAPDTDRGHSEGKGRTDTAGRPTIGKVASFNGTTLTLTLPNGGTKTFTVDAHAFGQLNPKKGSTIAVRSADGKRADALMPATQTFRGKVAAISRQLVTLTLPNGKTVTVLVAPQAVGHIPLTPGSQATLVSHDGGFSADVIKSGP